MTKLNVEPVEVKYCYIDKGIKLPKETLFSKSIIKCNTGKSQNKCTTAVKPHVKK